MKRYILLLFPLLVAVFLNGLQPEITQVSNNRVNIQLAAERGEIAAESVFSHTIALPAEEVQIQVNRMTVALYDANGELIDRTSVRDDSRVRITNSFIFREMYGFTAAVDLIRQDSGIKSVIEELDYDFVGLGSRAIPDQVSEVFLPLYEALAVNFNTSYLVNLPFKQPSMLILSHTGLLEAPTNTFARWKRARGFEVNIINRTDIAPNPSNTMIRDYLIDYYQNAENKPEYLLLIGGARSGAALPIPTFFAGDHNDAADLAYGLIEGDDYFPEMIVGRFSVNNAAELATVVSKTIAYEKEPFMDSTDWMLRNLVVAGNYASTLPIPITPVLYSKWLTRMFLDHHYTEVDTIFWRPGDPLKTQQVINAVNQGSQYINYRGWGAAMGWHYPQFHTNHLQNTIAGRRSPIVTSFVCNTGDFNNNLHNPCFGEAWMKMGSPTSPNGAVAFLGPSYLHTSTEFNNAISSGFHWGVQEEGIRCFGTAMLRGKIEIYNGYPNDQEPGGVVDYYFRIYNALSDPSLNMWVRIPNDMNIAIPTQIDQGTNYIDFAAPNLTGGYVTVTRDEEVYTTHRIEDDYAFIPINPEEQGDMIITVTAENYLPVIQEVEIVSSNNITLMDYEFTEGILIPGETITLNTTLKNYSDSSVSAVSATLTSNQEEYITITNDTVTFGDMSAGGTAEGSFEFEISPLCPHHTVVQFTLNILPTDDTAKIQALVVGILFNVESFSINTPNGILNPGDTATIDVSLVNIGNVDALNLIAYVEPQTNAVFTTEDPISFGDIPVGSAGTASFQVTAHSDATVGIPVYFRLDFEDQINRHTWAYFNTTLGEVTSEHPTGPCSYGYYAYDSFDTDYPQAPVYEWIDIDPQNGGPGDDLWVHDDGTFTMDLPFTFRYYGIDYDEVSICSNGWISFVTTEEINFRNWPLPSPIAPKGIIAPMWDDLKGLDAVDNEVRIAYYYDQANNRMIISWLDAYSVANLTPSGLEKIQLILEPRQGLDGDIIFQYHTIWNQNHARNYSTTGIMDHNRNAALQYSYANNYDPSATPLQGGMAIRITTDAPHDYVSIGDEIITPSQLSLKQNYPNPFNPETMIEFSLPNNGLVSLEVYNILGQQVKTLVNRELEPGTHRFVWNGTDERGKRVGSGVYLYRLSTPEESLVRRMILMK